MSRKLFVFVALVGAMLAPVVLTAREAAAAAGAQIVNPGYASGTYYSGQGVTSTLQVKNTGGSKNTFWIRHSVRDGAGVVRNVGATSVTVGAGKTSATISKTWTVPDPADPATLTTGPYDASFSVYDVNPDNNPGAPAFDYDEKPAAFGAHNFIDEFSSFDATRWTRSDKGLGFIREQSADEAGCGIIGNAVNTLYTTYLDPNNVGLNGNGQMQMRLPAAPSGNACANVEGGEIRSQESYKYGTYEVRMRIPDAPSSITGFFLYGGDGMAEIDIETFNEEQGKVMFTTYAENPDGSPNLNPDAHHQRRAGQRAADDAPLRPDGGHAHLPLRLLPEQRRVLRGRPAHEALDRRRALGPDAAAPQRLVPALDVADPAPRGPLPERGLDPALKSPQRTPVTGERSSRRSPQAKGGNSCHDPRSPADEKDSPANSGAPSRASTPGSSRTRSCAASPTARSRQTASSTTSSRTPCICATTRAPWPSRG